MKGLLKCVAVVAGLSMGFSACESSDCMLSSESYCSFSFVNDKGNSIKLLDTLSVLVNLNEYDTAYVYRCDTDTVVLQAPVDSLPAKGYELSLHISRLQGILLNRKTGADRIEIPLSYTSECDTFFFRYSTRLADTVWVEHLNHPYFSSMDCGTVMHYKITNVAATRHLIDSVEVVSSEVSNTIKDNVKIYYTVSN